MQPAQCWKRVVGSVDGVADMPSTYELANVEIIAVALELRGGIGEANRHCLCRT